MSLIQEALKRQQEEMGRQQSGKLDAAPPPEPPPSEPPAAPPAGGPSPVLSLKSKPAATPSAPAAMPEKDEEVVITPLPKVPGPPVNTPNEPLPPPPSATPPPPPTKTQSASRTAQSLPPPVKKEQEKKRSKTPLVVLLIILILIFLGVGATVGGKYLARRAENSLNSVIAEVPAVFQQAMEATVAEANKQIQNGNVLPPPPPGPGMTQVVPSEEGEGTTDLTTQVAATTEAKPTAPRSWPHLQLVGVVGKGKNGAAMISGSVVAAGDEINGVTVLEVRSNGALLEFNGEQRFLKTGGHIE